jgi:hypothetical protein
MLKPSFAKEPPSQRTTTDQMIGQTTYRQEGRTANMGLASCGVTCLNSSVVFQFNFSAGLQFCALKSRTNAKPKNVSGKPASPPMKKNQMGKNSRQPVRTRLAMVFAKQKVVHRRTRHSNTFSEKQKHYANR